MIATARGYMPLRCAILDLFSPPAPEANRICLHALHRDAFDITLLFIGEDFYQKTTTPAAENGGLHRCTIPIQSFFI